VASLEKGRNVRDVLRARKAHNASIFVILPETKNIVCSVLLNPSERVSRWMLPVAETEAMWIAINFLSIAQVRIALCVNRRRARKGNGKRGSKRPDLLSMDFRVLSFCIWLKGCERSDQN
jgi:hypothetical protein